MKHKKRKIAKKRDEIIVNSDGENEIETDLMELEITRSISERNDDLAYMDFREKRRLELLEYVTLEIERLKREQSRTRSMRFWRKTFLRVSEIPEEMGRFSNAYRTESADFKALLFIAALIAEPSIRDEMIGHLTERFNRDRDLFGVNRAKLLMARDVLTSGWPILCEVVKSRVGRILQRVGLEVVARFFFG